MRTQPFSYTSSVDVTFYRAHRQDNLSRGLNFDSFQRTALSRRNLTNFRLSALIITLLRGTLTARISFRFRVTSLPGDPWNYTPPLRAMLKNRILLVSSSISSRNLLASCTIPVPLVLFVLVLGNSCNPPSALLPRIAFTSSQTSTSYRTDLV